ncbi:MAG: response regulator [bacterium]
MAKIIIVDDDIEFTGYLSKTLQQAGYEVLAIHQTDGLMEVIVREMPDLLILDVMFPDNPVAGFDAARAVRLRSEIKDIPIIMLTAINEEHPMNFAARDIDSAWLPIQDFEEKPITRVKLLNKISKLLNAQAKK